MESETGAIRVTDAMVDAALGNNPRGSRFLHADDMRAALTAALALVPLTPGFCAGAEWAISMMDEYTKKYVSGDVISLTKIIRHALAALPSDPDVWSNAQKMFVQISQSVLKDSLSDYEYNPDDGGYTPNEFETRLLEDFAQGFLSELQQKLQSKVTALAALPEGGDGWMPIETHPGDTKTCLIAGKYPNGSAYVEKQFRHHDGHWNSHRKEPPTHWQPTPPPPSTQGTGT